MHSPHHVAFMCSLLNARLNGVVKNWEADKLVLVAILLASYTAHAQPQARESFDVLLKCRQIASEWITMINQHTLNAVLQNGTPHDIDEIRGRLAFISLCVILTFDAPVTEDAQFVKSGLLDFQLAVFTLYANTSSAGNGSFRKVPGEVWQKAVNLLYTKVHLVIARHLDTFHSLYSSSPQLLTDFVGEAFQNVKQNWLPLRNSWKRYSSPTEDYYWARAKNNNIIQIGIADGVFLVNGAPPQRLPNKIEESAIYRRIFGNHIFIVVPCGKGFITKDAYHLSNSTWEFSETKDTVSIVEYQNGKRKLQLLPNTLFKKELQKDLVENYAHWYCDAEKVIEFRPKRFAAADFVQPEFLVDWSGTQGAFLTNLRTKKKHLCMNGPLFKDVMGVFLRLDKPKHIHMYKNEDNITVQIVRMGLEFEVSKTEIRSVQFSDFTVSIDQYLSFLSISIIFINA